MALAEDASTPAVAHSATGTAAATTTSATFSPPANSLLVVSAQVMTSATFVGSPTISISSSNSLTFAQLVFGREINGGNGYGYAGFWCVYVPSGATNMTVTMTRSETSAGAMQLSTRVLTGAASTQTGATASADPPASSTSGQIAITPTALGSQLYFSNNVPASAITDTPVSGSMVIDEWNNTVDGDYVGFGKATALTSSTSSQTVGVTWTDTNSAHLSITLAVEILAGATPPAAASPVRVVTRVARIRSAHF